MFATISGIDGGGGSDWKYWNQTKMTDMLQLVASKWKLYNRIYYIVQHWKYIVLLIFPTCIYVDIDLLLSQFPRASRVQLQLSPSIYSDAIFVVFSY